MTLYFYTDKMPCLPKKNQRHSGMQTLHPSAPAPARGRHLFLIPSPAVPRHAPVQRLPSGDLRRQAARVIAITVRHWWP